MIPITSIQDNFNKGLWSVGMVAVAVMKNAITEEEFEEITGHRYTDVVTKED